MAYPTGHGHFPTGTTGGGDDWDEIPPDYDADTLPHPRRQNNDGGPRDNGVPPGHFYPDNVNVNGYPGHYRSGSGEFDNRVFDFSDHALQDRPSPAMVDRQRGYSPAQTTEIPRGFDHLDAAENGRNHQMVDDGGRYNPAFSHEEEPDQPPTLRRRYSPKKRSRHSSRRRRRGGGGSGDDDDDDGGDDSVDAMSPEELHRTMDILATLRVRRRVRRSLKRSPSQGEEDEGDGEEDYEELAGLPSAQANPKVKPLTQRLREMHEASSSAELARSLRDTYSEFDPTLVAGAAWKGWEKRKAQIVDFFNHVDIWSSHFKEIEGRFGSATASYFRFTRWLVFLNLYTFLVSFLVIVMPFFASTTPSEFGEDLTSGILANGSEVFATEAKNCSRTYTNDLEDFTDQETVQEQVLDFFVGTGWMEKTSMFYGHYHNRTFNTGGSNYNYNMGLAYILSIGITFFISFVLILFNSSHSVKETVMDDKDQSSVHFTNSVLCGWDYCIFDEKTATSKKRILFQEFKADLEEQRKRLRQQNRTNRQKLALFVVRVAVNFVVLCILGGALYLIYFTTDKLLEVQEEDEVLQLIIQFLPSLTITFLNFVIPVIFNVLVGFEDYWPAFELKITLIRTVFVRLSSVGVLTFSFYFTLLRNDIPYDCAEEMKTNVTKCCGNFKWENPTRNTTVRCWETYVGQQFYKLSIVDFLALLFVTFFIEFPRKWFFDHFKGKSSLVFEYGRQDFDIPKSVLEIVYYQSVSWLGNFFAPLLPAMTLIKIVLIFYIKKLTLMKNHAPPQQVYRVSKSNSFFNIILLISFVLVALIMGFMAGNINPSKSCGPFRMYSREDYLTWTALTDVVGGWPEWASTIFFFFGTTAFFVPCFIVLCLLMYYYWAVGQGFKRMEEILREQLRLEGKDKQFLLARVNDIIKHGNLQGVTSSLSQTQLPHTQSFSHNL